MRRALLHVQPHHPVQVLSRRKFFRSFRIFGPFSKNRLKSRVVTVSGGECGDKNVFFSVTDVQIHLVAAEEHVAADTHRFTQSANKQKQILFPPCLCASE